MNRSNVYYSKIKELVDTKIPFVTVTLVAYEGHVPQNIGAKLIVTENGYCLGTVGGGKLEAKAIEVGLEMLSQSKNQSNRSTNPNNSSPRGQLKKYDLQKDLAMVCGGIATLYFDLERQQSWSIVIFGAGHVSQATVPILVKLNAEITVVDPREEWLHKFSHADNLRLVKSEQPTNLIADFDPQTYFICMTPGHASDYPIVKAILQDRSPHYLGVIGSVPKSRTLKGKLIQDGIDPKLVENIKCPIGLPFGTNDPHEIAISIASQLLQCRDQNQTQSLGDEGISTSDMTANV
ncbi:MAG: XdhC family protein [Proteobacteria bacterium]|nr:XdhC family protein [Pseudomonadota bacterium]